jgi:ABC-type phosphate transport system substrate-binding protein
MRICLSWVGALGVLIASSHLASADNLACTDPSLPDPIIVSGSTAVQPLVQQLGKALAGTTTVIYSAQGSCVGVNNIVSAAPVTGTAIYFDATGAMLTCNLPTGGAVVDVGLSDIFVDSCTGAPAPSGIGQFSGPVESMLFVMPKAAQQQAITADEAYFVFGFGAAGMAKPWTIEANLAVRNSSSGTQGILASNIGVPAGRWKGTDSKNSTGVLNAITALAATAPDSAIGILGSDFYDAHRDTLKSLAFQGAHQYAAFYADSTATSFDKRNVRDGHYVNFGYLHMVTHVDANGVPSTPAAKRFVDWITGNTNATTGTPPPTGFDLFNATVAAKLVPSCAMKVQRTSEGGLIKPYTPPTDCSTAFEAAVPH